MLNESPISHNNTKKQGVQLTYTQLSPLSMVPVEPRQAHAHLWVMMA